MKICSLFFFVFLVGILHAQTNTFPPTGDAGIGTMTPGSKLEIAVGSATVLGQRSQMGLHISGGGYGGEIQQIGFGYGGSFAPSSVGNITIESSGFTTGALFFATRNTTSDASPVERMRIDPAGNIGIGTASPGSKLEIAVGGMRTLGQRNQMGLHISGGGYTGEIQQIGFGYGGDYAPSSIGNVTLEQSGYTTGALFFATRNTTSDVSPVERMRIDGAGNVGIGTTSPSERLTVKGNILAEKVIVRSGWSDYVFDEKYKLRSLASVASFIKLNRHLPDIPSAGEVEKNGLSVGDGQALLLRKIEELTLYVIDLKNENDKAKQEITILKKLVKQRVRIR